MLRGGSKSGSKRKSSDPKVLRIYRENAEWLRERSDRAYQEREEGELNTVKPWYFDEATEGQLSRVDSLGLSISGGTPSKGELSDIIGLFEPVEPENLEILRFHKISTKGFNQSRARYEVAKLRADPDAVEQWQNRPATQWQKEFYQTFDFSLTKSLTYREAASFINEQSAVLQEEQADRFNEWEDYESIYDDLQDPDTRESYEIKKFSVSAYRTAVLSLLEEGQSISSLAEDPDIVVNRLTQQNPKLQINID